MKILLTGGGTGGHFYPIVAVIQALRDLEREQNIINVDLYYAGDMPYQSRFFYDNEVKIKKIRTGKRRQYFSIWNFFDIFKTFFAIFDSLWYMYRLYPDVVFSKGGAVSFPILISARILRIPVMIHESDSAPGRTNIWSAKFARSIAISYPEAAEHFPKEKTVLTGNPVRNELMMPIHDGAKEFLNLEENLPVIAILGGSQGAMKINDTVIQALPDLLQKYQIIHQVGEKNVEYAKNVSEGILYQSEFKHRYKYFGHLDDLAMKMVAGVADLVISRAGSTIFEIAVWEIPSIIIPIRHSNGNHQVKNAYYYARAGAAKVIEEENLSPHLLTAEVDRLVQNPDEMERMAESAANFAVKDAAEKIAAELIRITDHTNNSQNTNDQ